MSNDAWLLAGTTFFFFVLWLLTHREWQRAGRMLEWEHREWMRMYDELRKELETK